MIPAGVRIFVCTEPVDMRWGFDRLAAAARSRVGEDPQDGGALFVFAGRSASRLKILWFEKNGCCLLYKRLHRAVFELPLPGSSGASVCVDAAALARLLAGASRDGRRRSSRKATRRANASTRGIPAHPRLHVVARHGEALAESDA